ncbi:MAG: PAS domain-containing protein [Alphaproteobacteria bacterium]|nr:PAS domain-containing protein [Alphaproteobacteria bacterium]
MRPELCSIMSERIDGDLGQHPWATTLLGWWHQARGAAPRPLRRAFDPVDFAPILGAFNLIDRAPCGTLRFRIRGERIFATDLSVDPHEPVSLEMLRPSPYSALVIRDYHEAMASDHPIGWRVTVTVPEFQPLIYRRLTLPLSSTEGASDMLLVFNPDALDPAVRRITTMVFRAYIAAYENKPDGLGR